MPVAVAFAPPDLFVVRATGDVTYLECQQALDSLLTTPETGETRKILIDARGVTKAPGTLELHGLARDMKPLLGRGFGPIAIVTDRTFVYGVARMFAVFAEAFGLAVSAFQSVDEASEWLERYGAGGPPAQG